VAFAQGPRASWRAYAAATLAVFLGALALPAGAAEPTGSISGAVTVDDPAVSARGLVVFAKAGDYVSDVVLADEHTGAYAITGLPDGTYTVYFQASLAYEGDTTLRNEVYDDVYVPADASLVTISGGGAVAGVDAQLSRTGHFTSAPRPSITWLTLTVGSTLGVSSNGTWSPAATFTLQWYRGSAPIVGATSKNYKLTTADRGKNITVKLTASKSGYSTIHYTSHPVYIPLSFTKAVTPTITGTTRSGYTLTADRGTWTPTPTYSYQWYRNGAAIKGATKCTYKLTKSDKGKKITVKVTAKRSGYLTTYKVSAAKTIAK